MGDLVEFTQLDKLRLRELWVWVYRQRKEHETMLDCACRLLLYVALFDEGKRRPNVDAARMLAFQGPEGAMKVRVHRHMVKHGIPRGRPRRGWYEQEASTGR